MNPTQELATMMRSMNRTGIMELLDAGADIDVQDEGGRTLLMRAMEPGSLEWCTELLERGASLHVRDHYEWTAWGCLCPSYGIPFYSLFLQYGADVNQYTHWGWTQLHWACMGNNHLVIHLLLTEGADPRLPVLSGYGEGKTAYDLGRFWSTPEGIRARFRWDTRSIQEVFILASERGLVPVPSYLW